MYVVKPGKLIKFSIQKFCLNPDCEAIVVVDSSDIYGPDDSALYCWKCMVCNTVHNINSDELPNWVINLIESKRVIRI